MFIAVKQCLLFQFITIYSAISTKSTKEPKAEAVNKVGLVY